MVLLRHWLHVGRAPGKGDAEREVIDVGVGREEVFVIASAKPKSIIV
jgi:hypothetical protein